MTDPMAGPNAPLAKAFISCGWGCLTVDWLLDPSQDLADERRQQSLSRQLEEVIFIAAAIDCSERSLQLRSPGDPEAPRPWGRECPGEPGPITSLVDIH